MTNAIDIAKLAKVSSATVSHVINNTRFVSDKTKKRVLDAMEELNYKPNLLARAFATGKTNSIGLIISDINNPFYAEFFRGAEDYAISKDYNIFLANSDHNINKSFDTIVALLKKKVDGLIIVSESDPTIIKELINSKVSFVMVNWPGKLLNMDTVYLDYKTGMDEAFKHLIEMGHKKIGFISGPMNNVIAKVRIDIFNELSSRYKNHGLNCKIFEGNHRISGGIKAIKSILSTEDFKPTAIICSNDLTAIGALKSLKEKDIRVPEEISLIGIDNISFTKFVDPPLSTISLDRYKIGKKSAQLLIERIENKEKAIEVFLFKSRFINRKSVDRENPS